MRLTALASLAPFAFFAGVAGLIASVACSNQGEGDFCSLQNGNNDCQSGLSCVAAPGLTGMAGTTTRCCPPSAALATKAVCMGASTEAGTPTGVGDSAVPMPDAPSDAPADAVVAEAAVEAGVSEPDADAGSVPSADASDGAPE
jgi:hypothetical protein